jgi:hypothetical protein
MSSIVTPSNTSAQHIPDQMADRLKGVFKEGESLYELTYKAHQQVARELFVANNMEEAKKLGNEYCTLYGKRFIFVTPAIKDFREAIKLKKDEA